MCNNLKIIFVLFFCSWAIAHEQETISSLSKKSHWLKLLHYSNPTLSSPKSDIISKDYFLAQDGAVNPESELKATVEAISSSQEIYCKFPSRRIWLERYGFQFPKRECPQFDEWTRGHSVKSVSLIFASGFLGNPASYFGHPLLKLNFKDERSPLDLLDTAINYGAFTPPNVNPFAYAIFGIFGGYDAGYTSTDFFFHKNNYSELELRDLWEYELKLSRPQIDELVAHLWDLNNAKIHYYFFSDNCAYRMANLLELVTNKKLLPEGLPFAIPASVFHKLEEHSLVRNTNLLESRQTRLKEKVYSLNRCEKIQLKKISQDINYIDSNEFKSQSVKEKSRVLEASMDYFSFRQVGNDDESLKEARKKILRARVSLPPGKSEWKKLSMTPPHKAQKPILTNLGYVHSETFGDIGSFRFRPAFYDIVSPDSARPPLSSLSVMDIELNATDNRLWLKSLNLISVEALNVSSTHLEGDGGYAWRFKVGVDQMNLACNTCTVPRIEVGAGKAWEVSRSFVLYAMVDPRLQTQYQGSGFVNVTPSLATLITFSNDFRINAVAGRRYYFKSDYSAENMYLVEGRIGSNRNWDMRVSFQEHVDRRYAVGLGLYW